MKAVESENGPGIDREHRGLRNGALQARGRTGGAGEWMSHSESILNSQQAVTAPERLAMTAQIQAIWGRMNPKDGESGQGPGWDAVSAIPSLLRNAASRCPVGLNSSKEVHRDLIP